MSATVIKEEKRLDPDLDDDTAKVLIGFCIHEHLNYPETKKLFLQQPEEDRKGHLAMMKEVIGNPTFDHALYKKFLADSTKKVSN